MVYNLLFQVFDAVIIIASFQLDIVFLEGVGPGGTDEGAALVIIFLLWRLLRVINGKICYNRIYIYIYINVTFHGNTVPAGDTLSLMSALYLWATLGCGVFGCLGNLV